MLKLPSPCGGRKIEPFFRRRAVFCVKSRPFMNDLHSVQNFIMFGWYPKPCNIKSGRQMDAASIEEEQSL